MLIIPVLAVLLAAVSAPRCVHAIPTPGDFMPAPVTAAAVQQSFTTSQSVLGPAARSRGFFGRRLLRDPPLSIATGSCPIRGDTAAGSTSHGGVVLALTRPSEGEVPVLVDGRLATPPAPYEWAITGFPRRTELYQLYDNAGEGGPGCTPERTAGVVLGQAQKCASTDAAPGTVCVAAVLEHGWVSSLEGTAVMASPKGGRMYAQPSSLDLSPHCTSGYPGGSCTWRWMLWKEGAKAGAEERSLMGFETCFSAPGVTDADAPFPMHVSLAYADGHSKRIAATPTACCGEVWLVAPKCQAALPALKGVR